MNTVPECQSVLTSFKEDQKTLVKSSRHQESGICLVANIEEWTPYLSSPESTMCSRQPTLSQDIRPSHSRHKLGIPDTQCLESVSSNIEKQTPVLSLPRSPTVFRHPTLSWDIPQTHSRHQSQSRHHLSRIFPEPQVVLSPYLTCGRLCLCVCLDRWAGN